MLKSFLFLHLICRNFSSKTRISVLCPPDFVCHAQGTPPEIWNGLDWSALVESRPPNIGKLSGWHFFLSFVGNFFSSSIFFFVEKKWFLRFSYCWNGLVWRALIESRPPNIGGYIFFFFFGKIIFTFNYFFSLKKRDLSRFLYFWNGLDWRALVK